MSDSSCNQRRFRTFNVIDGFNREALEIDIAVSLPAGRITCGSATLIHTTFLRGKVNLSQLKKEQI
nr:hypothetical protein [Gilliamella apicola]